MTLSPQLWRPEDDPEVPLGDGSPLARGFELRTGSAKAVLALLTPALQDLICGVKGRYLDVEAKDDTVIVTRRSWLEPEKSAAFLDDAAAIAAGLLDAARLTRQMP
jgi:hypothetical protein